MTESSRSHQEQVAGLKEQVMQLQAALLETQREAQARIAELENQIVIRNTLTERQRETIETLQAELENQQFAFSQERRQLELKQQQLEADVLDWQATAQKRAESVQRFKAELSLARTSITELDNELRNVHSIFETQQAEWERCRETLQARLDGYAETETEALQRWQAAEASLCEQLNQAQAQLQRQSERLAAYQVNFAELERAHGELSQRSSALQQEADLWRSRQAEWDHWQTYGAQIEDEVQRLRQEVINRDQLEAQITALTQHNTNLTHQLAQKQTQIENLSAEVNLWKARLEDQNLHILRLKKALERDDEPMPAKSELKTPSPNQPPPALGDEPPIDLPRFIRRT